MKKVIVILIALFVIISNVNTVFASENEYSYLHINPVYKDYVNEDDIISAPKLYSTREKALTVSASSENEVAETLRNGMVNRNEKIKISYKMKGEITSSNIDKWIESALAETDNPKEGDYLRWHYEYIDTSISWTKTSSVFNYIIEFKVKYYTTVEQEKALDREVENVFDEINISEANSDYTNLKLLYDYICNNITYDYYSSGMLKHTAYSALVKKTAVCQGYASLLYYMGEKAGIDMRVIAGYSFGEMHGWNIAELDNRYYNLDATWDAGYYPYEYFLRGSKNFKDHTAFDEYDTKGFKSQYPISANDFDASQKAEAKIEKTKFVYTGDTIFPVISVTDLKGKKLEEGISYYLADDISAKDPGVYVITVNFCGDYSGSQEFKYVVYPSKIENLSAKLSGGHDDIQISWEPVNGATGYYISYKKAENSNYTSQKRTAKNKYTLKDLSDDVIYDLRVVPYYEFDGTKYFLSSEYAYATCRTLKNVKSPSSINVYLNKKYDDVKISWSKSTGAEGYNIYYKTSSDEDYMLLTTTTAKSTDKAKELSDGVKYTFKVVPYYLSNNEKVESYYSKSKSIYTLKQVDQPKVSKSSVSKVKVKWNNINGESGYQISKSTNSKEKGTITTYKTTSGTSKTISASKRKTYYYKVRAYKIVNNKKIYGPWSEPTEYKL